MKNTSKLLFKSIRLLNFSWKITNMYNPTIQIWIIALAIVLDDMVLSSPFSVFKGEFVRFPRSFFTALQDNVHPCMISLSECLFH